MPKTNTRSDPITGIGAGAPDTEIEITPEMIDAGQGVLADFDCEYDRIDKTVIKILRAAFGARS
jgi:hypothetical protein